MLVNKCAGDQVGESLNLQIVGASSALEQGFTLFLDLYTCEIPGSIYLWNLISWSLGIVAIVVIILIFILAVISSYFVSWSWMQAFNLWYSFIEQWKLKSWIICLHLAFSMNCYLLYVCHYLCIMYRATYWK